MVGAARGCTRGGTRQWLDLLLTSEQIGKQKKETGVQMLVSFSPFDSSWVPTPWVTAPTSRMGVFVGLISLWLNTGTKAPYRQKGLFGLGVPESKCPTAE